MEPTEPQSTPEFKSWAEVQEHVHQVLSSLGPLIGPRTCAHGAWVDCYEEECTFSETTARQAFLGEWVICAMWLGQDSEGEDYFESAPVGANGHPDTRLRGLLHRAIEDL